jgi:hypothetical protein
VLARNRRRFGVILRKQMRFEDFGDSVGCRELVTVD